MRKITNIATYNLIQGIPFKSGNDKVVIENNVAILSLHGNKIAFYDLNTKKLSIRNAGWFSSTTKERLNGLPNVSIQQKKGIWYLNGKQWDGTEIEIN